MNSTRARNRRNALGRTRRRFGLIVLTVVLAASGLNISAAFAACPVESGWEVTGRSDYFQDVGITSNWVTAPSTGVTMINVSQTKAASMSSSQSVSVGVSIGTIIAKAEVKYQLNWDSSTSWSKTWSYSFQVPPGKKARLVLWKEASRFTFKKWSVNSLCTTTWSSAYYQYSPSGPQTDPAKYCWGLDYTTLTTVIWSGNWVKCSDG